MYGVREKKIEFQRSSIFRGLNILSGESNKINVYSVIIFANSIRNKSAIPHKQIQSDKEETLK
jgi:hypothetical protein